MRKKGWVFDDIFFSDDCGEILMTFIVYGDDVGAFCFACDAIIFKGRETFVVINSLKIKDTPFFNDLVVA